MECVEFASRRARRIELIRIVKNYTTVELIDGWLLRFLFDKDPMISDKCFRYGIRFVDFGCNMLNDQEPYYLEISLYDFMNWVLLCFRGELTRNIMFDRRDFYLPDRKGLIRK